ncbi:MAG: hypothetical protein LLF83_07920, partial [Methanobacterium sp.]|nr:hypothetical protein [Methanobacterium sp.]
MKKVIFFLLFLLAQVSYGQWEAVNNGFSKDTLAFGYLAVKGNMLFAGTGYLGIYLSTDNGDSWIAKNSGLIGSRIEDLEVQGNNIWVITSYVDPESGSVYNIFMSSNDGNDWILKNSGLPQMPFGGVDIGHIVTYGDSIFALTTAGIYFSKNNGDDWSQVYSPLKANKICFGNNFIFIDTGPNLLRSTDNGQTWEVKNNGLPQHGTTRIAIKGDTLFAGVWGDGLYRSTDKGETWEAKNSGLTIPDPRCILIKDDIIFIGTSAPYINNLGGVYVSTDGGENWVQKISGLTDLWVTDLAISGDRIFAATSSEGVFRAKLSDLTTDVKESEPASSNSIYPNPARDFINTADYLGWEYQMYDLLGNNVQMGLVNSENINISKLSAG